jgi:hypothetical protein
VAPARPTASSSSPTTAAQLDETPIDYDPATRKLQFFDALNPLRRIAGFFLNFEARDAAGVKVDGGKDFLFGDHGHDWLVGDTLNDRLFGGMGDDVLNSDDVRDVEARASGVRLTFSRAVDRALLDLYGAGAPVADFVLFDALGRVVPGSAALTSDGLALELVRTAGLLDPGFHSVTLRGEAGGVTGTNGLLIDGDRDGVLGGDAYLWFFAPDAAGVVVSLPDFARGPGQAVGWGPADAGLALRLNEASGVESVSLRIAYDPRLLDLTAARPHPSQPGSAVTWRRVSPGIVELSVRGLDATRRGPVEIAVIEGAVPMSAPYRLAQVLALEQVAANGGALAARGDGALQLVAYVGDADGDRTYGALDAQRLLRVAAGLDSGFSGHPLVHPLLVGDVTRNGAISALDASHVLQEAVGIDSAAIPALPPDGGGAAIPPAAHSSATLTVSDAAARPGETATVRVSIDEAAGLEALDLEIAYDPRVLTLSSGGAARTALTSDAVLVQRLDPQSGRLTVALAMAAPRAATSGAADLLSLSFTVAAGAIGGTAAVDAVEARLNGGEVALREPAVAGADAVDGAVEVLANHAPVLSPIPAQTVEEDSVLSFTAKATDADAGDTLTYSLSGAPAGAAIDLKTGVFKWTPAKGQAGTYSFSVVVTDSGSPRLSDAEVVSVTVKAKAVLSYYSSTSTSTSSSTSTSYGAGYSYSSSSYDKDDDGDPYTYSYTYY